MSDQLSSDLASLRIERDARPEGGRLVRVLVILALLGAAAAGAYFALLPYLSAKVWKKEVAVTQVTSVSPSGAAVQLTTTGYVVPQVTAKVGSKVPGRIAEVAVVENQQVQAGQLIARLEDADQKSAIAAAESRVQAARARAQTARAQLAEVRVQLKRERALAQKGVTPMAVVEDLEAREHSLSESAKAADAEVKAAQSEVHSLKVTRDYLTIVAPIDGTVVSKPMVVGESVTPGGPPIVEIADFRSLVVETDVPEGRLDLVGAGSPCEIVLDAYPRRRFPGRTLEIGRKVDRAKATIRVKVKFDEATDDILPDMAARVSFLTAELTAEARDAPDKLVVPATAIAERAGAKVVFVIVDGRVKQMAVQLGPKLGSGFELVNGPAAGTRVVANPPADLQDGQKIKEKSE